MVWEERTVPYRHWVCDDLMDGVAVARLADAVVRHWREHRHGPAWVKYDNDVERKKWAMPDPNYLGHHLFVGLTSGHFVSQLSAVTGVKDLQPDPTLHGAGFHVVEPGGWLGPHLDYALHPKLPNMERRVNLVLFLNGPDANNSGSFCLLDDECKEVKARVYPRAGRAVMWCPGDVEYHATDQVHQDSEPRVAACCYYLAPVRPGVVRKRALFVPNRGM